MNKNVISYIDRSKSRLFSFVPTIVLLLYRKPYRNITHVETLRIAWFHSQLSSAPLCSPPSTSSTTRESTATRSPPEPRFRLVQQAIGTGSKSAAGVQQTASPFLKTIQQQHANTTSYSRLHTLHILVVSLIIQYSLSLHYHNPFSITTPPLVLTSNLATPSDTSPQPSAQTIHDDL